MESDSKPILLVKYGGNAMTNRQLQENLLAQIADLQAKYRVVIVHGGGPFIQEALDRAQIESEFVDGHRKTSPEALKHVEMALKGEVNGTLVSLLNRLGTKAVGLSGKDGGVVRAKKRLHHAIADGRKTEVDLGQVGDVDHVEPELIHLLLQSGYLPVLTCIAADRSGQDFNINADMFAGHLAGAIGAQEYIVLTDVDGLMKDKDDPNTLIQQLLIGEIAELLASGVIQGGMLPKMESCQIALQEGAQVARIMNGTKPEQFKELLEQKEPGTRITMS